MCLIPEITYFKWQDIYRKPRLKSKQLKNNEYQKRNFFLSGQYDNTKDMIKGVNCILGNVGLSYTALCRGYKPLSQLNVFLKTLLSYTIMKVKQLN